MGLMHINELGGRARFALRPFAENSVVVVTGLVGMTDALMYVQQANLQSHTFPEELQKLLSPDAMTSSNIVQLKLSR